MQADYETLTLIPAIGPKIAASVVKYFEEPHNRELVNKLKSLGVNTEGSADHPVIPQTLAGKTLVVTGALTNYGRMENRRGYSQPWREVSC